jgi:hypothetical protein
VQSESASSSTDSQTYLLATSVLTPEGEQMFSSEQAKELAKAAPEVVDAVSKAICALSGMSGEDDPKND